MKQSQYASTRFAEGTRGRQVLHSINLNIQMGRQQAFIALVAIWLIGVR